MIQIRLRFHMSVFLRMRQSYPTIACNQTHKTQKSLHAPAFVRAASWAHGNNSVHSSKLDKMVRQPNRTRQPNTWDSSHTIRIQDPDYDPDCMDLYETYTAVQSQKVMKMKMIQSVVTSEYIISAIIPPSKDKMQ